MERSSNREINRKNCEVGKMFNKLIKFDSIAFPFAIERVEMNTGDGIMRITFLLFHIDFIYHKN